MNYFVTGGAGFIGSHLVDRLLADGHQVTVIDNFSTGKKENLPQNKSLEIIKQEICGNLENIFKKTTFDAVFHLAAIPRVQLSINNPTETHETNINGTFNLLMVCKKFNVKKFIFSSSSSVYGDQNILPLVETMNPKPVSPYALHKLVGEHYCRLFYMLYGLETISLRYFNVFGPRQNPEGGYANLIPKFFKFLSNNENPTINGDGEKTRDFTFVMDVVKANIQAAFCQNQKCFGEIFNIGGGKNYSVNQVAKIIVQLTKSKARSKHGPSIIEPQDTLADISKAKKLLGWEPKIKFEEGMKITYRSLQ